MTEVQSPARSTFFSLDQLSDEQRNVVAAVVVERCNVIVNAVAGSGKTRTALVTSMEWVSSHFETDNLEQFPRNTGFAVGTVPMVLLVAYNRLLMEDMAKQKNTRVPPHLRDFIEIRTIHSLGRHYFGGEGITTDRDLYKWMDLKKSPKKRFPPYNLVIIDEAQDLNPILFNFLLYVLSHLNHPQLLILGDPFQLLYRFNGADERFILEANERFAEVVAAAPFKRFKLSICFRITHEMANWINIYLNPNNLSRAKGPDSWRFEDYCQQISDWWGDGIRANPHRAPSPGSVTFCNGSVLPYPRIRGIVDEMTDVLEKYDSNSFALLASSLSREGSPARVITNNLRVVARMEQSWFIDVGSNTDDGNFSRLRTNKRVASTIHKFKGRECDAIVLAGFDGFFEERRISDPRDLFNVYYVAATRARERLHIIQWDPKPFATCRIEKNLRLSPPSVDPVCLVTRALEYCGYDPVLCEESSSCLTTRTASSRGACLLSGGEYTVPGSHHAHKERTMENVSAIIGLAVEIRLQLVLDDGKLIVPTLPERNDSDDEDHIDEDLKNYVLLLKKQASHRTEYSWTDVMKIATAYLTLGDKFYSRWRQVRNFSNWAIVKSSEKLKQIIMNLVHLLYIPFCLEELTGKWDTNIGADLTQSERAKLQTFDEVSYEQKVLTLKKLRREGRILFHGVLDFRMVANQAFVEKVAKSLSGEMDITLISREIVEKWKRVRKYRAARVAVSHGYRKIRNRFGGLYSQENGEPSSDEEVLQPSEMTEMKKAAHDAIDRVATEYRNDNLLLAELTRLSGDGAGVTIIEVKVTSRTDHNHALQLGCYGAMWREASRWANGDCASQNSKLSVMDDNKIVNLALEDVLLMSDCMPKATQAVDEPSKIPRMFLVYPNLGLLREVHLGMNSEEYLHRIGFRKANSPFDPNVLMQQRPQ